MLGLDNARDHSALGLSDDQILDMYRMMLLARKLDERVWALNRQGRVPFVVSVAGHEGTQVGAAFALDTETDWSLPYYRDVAFNLAMGLTPLDMFLAVFAKASDPANSGRQMPNHWSDPDRHIFTHSSVIATQFPHACGVAYHLKATGQPGVVLVSSGEGATSEGDWHEAMNFAGIHQLPMIFLIQNNLYAISVPAEQEIAGGVAPRASGYGMPGVEVDGNDVLAVYGVTSAAVQRARSGEGPSLIEAKTYRYYAHTSDDDDKVYRSAEEVELWRRKDPILVLKQYLVESRLLDEATEARIEREVTNEIAVAVKEADEAPEAVDWESNVYAAPIVPEIPATEPETPPVGENVNMITAVNRTLHELFAKYDDVVIFGEDVADPKGGVFKATVGLSNEFGGNRSFNTPLAESLIVGIGIGVAAAGGRPIAEIQFADFIHPAFDQIVSELARIHYRTDGRWATPLVIRVPYGGGISGSLYHSQSVEAFYAHVPGLKVVVPSTPADLKGLLWSAVEDPDPVMVFEPKKLYRLASGPYPEGSHRVPIGKAALRTTGDDLTIIAYGTMAHYAVEAAARLAREDIEAAVLDLRSLRPLDWPSIEHAVQTNGKVLIVHEDNKFGGFGAEVAAQIAEKALDWLDAPVLRYCSPEVPTFPYAGSLEEQVIPSIDGLVSAARELAAY
ncbi:MAG: dehydrogenase E1 component subunit alpha/beta [Acidimicrobiia bacterium]|nr:dehydrogenase E1 component subunit alpha/beta [Acidimicrobiia bacterium]